jgi:hypothetical protein
MGDNMSIRDEPHFKIASTELAAWLESQGTDRWWSIDGDAHLGRRLYVPFPADELVTDLRRINKTLLVEDLRENPSGRGERIVAKDLDGLATHLWGNVQSNGTQPASPRNRIFALCWEDRSDEWLLLEDLKTTESERREAAAEQATRM